MSAPVNPRGGKIDRSQFQASIPDRDDLVIVSLNGVVIGQEREINFVAGPGVSIAVTAPNQANPNDPPGRLTITISAP